MKDLVIWINPGKGLGFITDNCITFWIGYKIKASDTFKYTTSYAF